MKRVLTILLVFGAIIFAGLVAGTGFRYLTERIGVQPPGRETARETESAIETEEISNANLCISFLGIQSDLPTPRYTHETADAGITVVKRDGTESFLIYPLIQGLDLEAEYNISELPSFIAEKLEKPVYRFDDQGQTSYLVPARLPFFTILLQGSPDDKRSEEDVKQFLNSIQESGCRN